MLSCLYMTNTPPENSDSQKKDIREMSDYERRTRDRSIRDLVFRVRQRGLISEIDTLRELSEDPEVPEADRMVLKNALTLSPLKSRPQGRDYSRCKPGGNKRIEAKPRLDELDTLPRLPK